MPEYINTTGNNRLAIAICGRCSLKFAIDELEPDINYPGLLVCKEDSDWYDPYRLPPRETEDITLTMPRPDTRLPTTSVAPGDVNWPTNTFLGAQGAAQKPTTGNS
jgi:hypothetical protein